MLSTELNQQRINCPHLNTATATDVADLCRFDVVRPVWLEKGQGREAFDKLGVRLRSCEALQQFLQDQSCGENLVCAKKRVSEHLDLGR